MQQHKRHVLDEESINRCHQLVDELVELFKETDPALGSKSEAHKFQKAYKAINAVGMLGAILSEWAEAQILGHYWQAAKSKNYRQNNSHSCELMWYDKDALFDHFTVMPPDDYRRAISGIIFNSYRIAGVMSWRAELNRSLDALNDGHVYPLIAPMKTQLKGNAYEISELKWIAIQHVYRLVGEGEKKMAAQQIIAEHCGATADAIKKWEKLIIKDYDPDKEALNKIKLGAQIIAQTKKDVADYNPQDFLHYAATMLLEQKTGESSETPVWEAVVFCMQLTRNEPLETLKERFIEAGARISS